MDATRRSYDYERSLSGAIGLGGAPNLLVDTVLTVSTASRAPEQPCSSYTVLHDLTQLLLA